MTHSPLEEILQRLRELEAEVEVEIEKLLQEKQAFFQYHFDRGRVRFEQSMKTLQRQYRIGLWSYLVNARLMHVLTAPVVYSLLPPFMLLDLFVSLYQGICFRIYGIALVKRSNYIVIDRHHLAYLNLIEKVHCVYCGYINGLIEYIREISARTELYWCPIKHARRSADPHQFNQKFTDFGDAKAYYEKLEKLRNELISQAESVKQA